MGRYANRTIRLEFPDLSEDDDLIYVVIRNPKTVPASALMPDDVPDGPDGKPETAAAITASYGVMAGLIVDWHVYDGSIDDDDAPPLELPADVDKIRNLPLEITHRIATMVGEVVTPPQ